MVKAIDVHVHPPGPHGESLLSSEAARKYFKAEKPLESVDEMAEYYAKIDVFGVVFAIDNESVSGFPPPSNDYIADIQKKYPKQFIAFGSVDPRKGDLALHETRRCAEELGMKGLKLMPNMGRFFPNDEPFYPIWEEAQKLGMVLLIHTGTTGVGAGHARRRRREAQVLAADPLHRRPCRRLPGAEDHHGAPCRGRGRRSNWPCSSTSRTSTWTFPAGRRSTFQPSLVQYANTLVQDKVLFGSD